MGLSLTKSGLRKSYAKVNLHLQIGERREDGYHDIFSLFHLVDLCDDIEITAVPHGTGRITIRGMKGIRERDNIMWKAASLFLSSVKATADDISITITKRIPLGGGLGGGSSNAATVLLTLNEMYGTPLTEQSLAELALSVGSDVPFFIYRVPVAVVEGRGEVITPLKARGDLFGSIVLPLSEGISTAQAFRKLDERKEMTLIPRSLYTYNKMCHMYNQPVSEWLFKNDFRSVVEGYSKKYTELYSIAEKRTDLFGTVSGSGATFIFVGEEAEFQGELTKEFLKGATQDINISIKYLNNLPANDTVILETSK